MNAPNLPAVYVPMNELERMAGAVAKSGLFGVKTVDQAMALMLIAQAEGMHPAIAARDYHVIQGRPALKADAMLARFQQAGGSIKWGEYTDKRVAATFTHPQGGTVEVIWTIEQATKAKLTEKETWRAYPRQMLRARVISEGIRTVFPGCVVGVYTPEEVQDMPPERDVTPAGAMPKAQAVRDALRPKEPADVLPGRPYTLAEALHDIEAATTLEQLALIVSAVKSIDDHDERKQAVIAGKAKTQRIKNRNIQEALGNPDPEAAAERAAIQGEGADQETGELPA